MRHLLGNVFLTLLLSFFCCGLTGQKIGNTYYKNVRFEKLHTEGDNTFSTIRSLIQDSSGFIWFSTRQGLVRFDGYEFKTYTSDLQDSTSLISNDIWDLCIDKNNEIWIASKAGIHKYNRETDNFEAFRFFDELESHQIFVRCLYSFKNLLYVGTGRGVIYIYDTSSRQKVGVVNLDYSSFKDPIRDLIVDTAGALWVATENSGVYYAPQTDSIMHALPVKVFKNSSQSIMSLHLDLQGYLWIGTRSGLIRYNISTKTHKTYLSDKTKPGSLSDNGIFGIDEDNNGNLWISTNSGGLNLYLRDSDQFYSYNLNSYPQHFFDAKNVRNVYSDRSNNLWVITFNKGLYFVDGNTKGFKTVQYQLDRPDILNQPSLRFILPYKNKTVLLGCDGGGINLFDLKTHKGKFFTKGPHPKSIPSNKAITGLLDGNTLWVGMWAGGLAKMDISSGTFTQIFPDSLRKKADYSVYCLEKCGDILYIGTHNGLYRYNTTENSLKKFSVGENLINGTSSRRINIVKCFSDNKIYIGTTNGLNIYNPKNNKFTHYLENLSDSNSLSDRNIITLFEDSKSRIWIGEATNGLISFSPEKQRFKIEKEVLLASNQNIKSITEDKNGLLWIGTSKGLICYHPDTKELRTFNTSDGIFGPQLNKNCIAKCGSGNIYIGGTGGFSYFNPDSIRLNPFEPLPAFTKFLLFNKEIDIHAHESPLKRNINQTGEITLKHFHNIFSIEFSALNYSHPENNLYQYYLEGFEDRWNAPGKKRQATYTNLNPGKYTFHLRASNNDEVWSPKQRVLNITVLAPFWKTKLFYGLISVLLILSAVVFYRIRVFKIEQQKDYLEKVVARRTKQLNLHKNHLEKLVELRTIDLNLAKEKAIQADNLKTSFLANMSHEIRTPMNGIIGFLNLLERREITQEKRKLYFKNIYQNADFLINLIDNILDYSRIETNNLHLDIENLKIKDINESLATSFKKLYPTKDGLTIQLQHLASKDNYIRIDFMRLKQVLQQLIDNALKYCDSGFVSLTCELNDYNLIYTVKDKGIGIDEKFKKRIFDGFFKIENRETVHFRGTGIGLTISRHIIREFGGELWLAYSKPGEGTVFKVSIPTHLDSAGT